MNEGLRNLKLLGFICLALKDVAVIDYDSLVRISLQYGINHNVTKKQIETVLKKKLVEFIIKGK